MSGTAHAGPPGTAAGDKYIEVATATLLGALARFLASSRNREQRGVFVARGTTVCITDPGCAGEEPEGLAQNLAPQVL